MTNAECLKLQKRFNLIIETATNDLYNLGDEFFEKIVLRLNEILEADYTFVGKLSDDKSSVETISLVHKQLVIENFSYDLKNTPCENVIGQRACSYASDITKLFPNDQLLIDMGIDAYIGVPLYDSKKEPTGIIVALYEHAIIDTHTLESVLMIFAARAGAELEHKKLYASLEKHKQELELIVAERTKELNTKNTELQSTNQELANTLFDLQNTQTQLIQSEKMASLGTLTAGVAHEINNPLNYILGGYAGLQDYFEENKSANIEKTEELLNHIKVGIDRASGIVKGLNQFSRTTKSMNEECDIHSILDNCLLMLREKTIYGIGIEKYYTSTHWTTKGNVGMLHQVFTNVLTNALQSIEDKGVIKVTTSLDEQHIIIEVSDSGCGIKEEYLSQITDPFFTTKPPGQGTGLGLSITYSLIKAHKGDINFISKINEGTTVKITLATIP